jgi:hypothetical protein
MKTVQNNVNLDQNLGQLHLKMDLSFISTYNLSIFSKCVGLFGQPQSGGFLPPLAVEAFSFLVSEQATEHLRGGAF